MTGGRWPVGGPTAFVPSAPTRIRCRSSSEQPGSNPRPGLSLPDKLGPVIATSRPRPALSPKDDSAGGETGARRAVRTTRWRATLWPRRTPRLTYDRGWQGEDATRPNSAAGRRQHGLLQGDCAWESARAVSPFCGVPQPISARDSRRSARCGPARWRGACPIWFRRRARASAWSLSAASLPRASIGRGPGRGDARNASPGSAPTFCRWLGTRSRHALCA